MMMMANTTISPHPTTTKPPTTSFLFLFYTFLLLLLLIMASFFFIQQQGFSTHELVTLRPRRQRVVSTDSSTSLKGLHFQGVRKGWKSRNSRRLMIGSTAPICTYNECRGCKFRCRAEQIPVDANDPINSAYHYRCVCHRGDQAIGKISGPTALTGLLIYSRAMISMVFLGYLGELELAEGSLSIGFTNIMGYSVISGLAMGMEPICGQAFGAKQWKLLGLTLQRTVLLLLCTSIPISLCGLT